MYGRLACSLKGENLKFAAAYKQPDCNCYVQAEFFDHKLDPLGSYNITPGSKINVIVSSKHEEFQDFDFTERVIIPMRYGIIPAWAMELREQLKLPSNWTHQSEEVVKVKISSGTSEYNSVRLLLSGNALSKLTSVYRIQNPYLFHRYLTRKLEYQARNISFTEQTLLHATADHKIDPIIKDNLDYRLVSRAKFGKGVSFSPCATYANEQCSRSNGNSRAMIVAKVLVGSCMSGRENLIIPPIGFDTTTGNSKKVFVKYYDDEFYPEYVAYYTSEIVYKGRVRQFNYDNYFDYDDPLDSYDKYWDI